MKKNYIFLISLSFLILSCEKAIDEKKEEESIKKVLTQYKTTLENLSLEGIPELFTKDSKVYESGKLEGSIEDYLGHHLGPELGAFESFKFNDYSVEVDINSPFAFSTESYIYKIVLKADTLEDGTLADPRIVERKGIATSILKEVNGTWKIMKTHSSSRKPRKNNDH